MKVRFVARGGTKRECVKELVVVSGWSIVFCVRFVAVGVAFRSALHSHVITLSRYHVFVFPLHLPFSQMRFICKGYSEQ